MLSILTTILAGYQYGTETEANVLQMLPRSNLLYGAILLVTLQLCLSHAVGSSALFQNIEEYMRIPKGKTHPFYKIYFSFHSHFLHFSKISTSNDAFCVQL